MQRRFGESPRITFLTATDLSVSPAILGLAIPMQVAVPARRSCSSTPTRRAGPITPKNLLPMVRPGGLILVPNIGAAREYARAITTNSNLEATFFIEGAGMGITVKKRPSQTQ